MDLVKLQKDIDKLIVERNNNLYTFYFCDVCFEKIKNCNFKNLEYHVSTDKHRIKFIEYVKRNNNLSYDEIIKNFIKISDFYHLKFIYL